MKKILSILTIILVSGLLVIQYSCNGGDDNESQDPILSVSGFTGSTMTQTPGYKSDLTIIGQANPNSNSDLKTLTLHVSYSTGGTLDTTFTINASESKYVKRTFAFIVPKTAAEGEVINLSFKLTDKAGLFAAQNFTINVHIITDIYTFADTLGAQANLTLGSFFATQGGKVYTITQAKSNQATVDFDYLYDASNGATIAAPGDALSISSFSSTTGPSSWSVKNATKFRQVAPMDDSTFQALTAEGIGMAYTTSTATEATHTNALADISSGAASFYAFKTISPSKYGILRVEEINDAPTGAEGWIRITVKLQK